MDLDIADITSAAQGGGRRGRWLRDYREAVDEFWEAGVGMLEGEWMILPGASMLHVSFCDSDAYGM